MNNIARGVLTAFLCVVLVGFGLCGAFGTFSGLADLGGAGSGELRGIGPILIGFGLVGLVIAWLCWLEIAKLWRKRPPAGE
jgi:tellurite resistance protein TehA-like permease